MSQETLKFVSEIWLWFLQLATLLSLVALATYFVTLEVTILLEKRRKKKMYERRKYEFHARQFGKTQNTRSDTGVQLSRNGWSKEAHKLAEEFCGIRPVRRPWWKFW